MNTFGCVWKLCFFPVFGHLSREDHDLSSNFGVSCSFWSVSTQALQEVLLSQTRFANFLLLFAAGSGIHVASKYRETITQHLNVTRGVSCQHLMPRCVDIFWTLRIFETWNVIKGSMLKLWLLWYEPCSKPLIGGWLWRVLLPNTEYIKYSSSIFFGIPSSTTLGRSSKAASFDSAERAERLVQLIHNLKRLPPNFWYSSAATGLLSLQIAQRLGVFGT